MNRIRLDLFFLCGVLFLVDRVSKSLALAWLDQSYRFGPFITFSIEFNRGVSWGLFNSASTIIFFAISAIVCLMLAGVAAHTYIQIRKNKSVIGELFILAGGASNIIDRFLYHGVVDFIVCTFFDWHVLAFNLADIFIVIGIGIALYTTLYEL